LILFIEGKGHCTFLGFKIDPEDDPDVVFMLEAAEIVVKACIIYKHASFKIMP
jgi:hypothetical protein